MAKCLGIFLLSLCLLANIQVYPPPAFAQEETTTSRTPARPLPAEMSGILFREDREQLERPEQILDWMELEDGDIVADIGSGPGYYSLRVAARVAPHGHVFAVDIQEGMLEQLRQRMTEHDVNNVYPILGELADPLLPPGKIDWVLLVDAYHEFGDPESMLAKIRECLAPDGRVALVEYRAEENWPGTPEIVKTMIPRDHKMTIDEVLTEWLPAGFELIALHEDLPGQHVFIFEVTDGN